MAEDREQNWPQRIWQDLEQAEAQHLSYAQLEAYVDAKSEPTEAELVRAHAELCSQCAAELQDLQQFAIGLKTQKVPQPVRLSSWERLAAWFKVPRHTWAAAGAVAVLTIILALPHSGGLSNTGVDATLVGSRPLEAVLESRQAAPGGTFEERGRRYRVLTAQERENYRKEIASAPDDPTVRGAIDIRYSLFGEAEKEYGKLEAAGGDEAQKGRLLLQKLDHVREGR